MAKPETKRPETQPKALVMSSFTFHPTRDDTFRMVRARGSTLWAIQVTRVQDGKHVFTAELDPPDTLDIIERKIGGLVQEAERR